MKLVFTTIAIAYSIPTITPRYYLPFYKVNPFVRENLPWDIYNPNSSHGKWSTEHVVPKSLFPEDTDGIKDLYNLFNTSPTINSHRSDYKFSERIPVSRKLSSVSEDIHKPPAFIDTSNVNYKDTKKKLWLPIENARGPLARSIMYMLIVYDYLNVDDIIEPHLLHKWNTNYPPRQWEIQHMWKIYNIQGNINPFILKLSL